MDCPDQPMCPNCVTPWKCNGPHFPVTVSDGDADFAAIGKLVAAKMHSHNNIPVERCVIKRDEIDAYLKGKT